MRYNLVADVYFGIGLLDVTIMLFIFLIVPEWFSILVIPDVFLLAGVMIWSVLASNDIELVENYMFYLSLSLLLQPILLLVMLIVLFDCGISYTIVPIRERIGFVVFIEYFMLEFVFDAIFSGRLWRGAD